MACSTCTSRDTILRLSWLSLRRSRRWRRRSRARWTEAFATHPQTPDRIEASQKEIATILPARPEYTVTTSEFDEVKARLAAIENRRKMVDHKDAGKPSLRRASSTDKNGTDDKTSDDDRPTLKRRDDSSNN